MDEKNLGNKLVQLKKKKKVSITLVFFSLWIQSHFYKVKPTGNGKYLEEHLGKGIVKTRTGGSLENNIFVIFFA